MWTTILDTIASEFSDAPDLEQFTRIMTRLLLAAVLGGVLGYERESKGKAAGIRTHMLVAMGAALFVLVPELDGMGVGDMSRVIQGIVTGIGFLGAGAIIKQGATEGDVQGLTTAAGIWMTAAIGIACGLGRESTAVISTVLALTVLALVPRMFGRDKH
jgi:putative Mg2+ transporter-C (MgtC) family protein